MQPSPKMYDRVIFFQKKKKKSEKQTMPCHDFAPEKEKLVAKKFPYPLRNDPDAYISPHFFPEKKKAFIVDLRIERN